MGSSGRRGEPSGADLEVKHRASRRKGKEVSMGPLVSLFSREVFSRDGDQEFKFC